MPAPAHSESKMTEPVMPAEILAYMNACQWSTHHAAWHGARIWHLIGDAGKAFVTRHAGGQASRQEGAPGNGMDFLAMHRVMLETLRTGFPTHSRLLDGWVTVPIDPNDPNDPKPQNLTPAAFDSKRIDAVRRIEDDIGSYKDDDDLGLFIQTRLRPLPNDPRRTSTDPTVGLHNYLHERFSSPGSGVDMERSDENFKNQRFWRLHGWIDARWQAFREAKHLGPNDPVYVAAMKEQRDHMMAHPTPARDHAKAMTMVPEPVPHDVRNRFAVINDF